MSLNIKSRDQVWLLDGAMGTMIQKRHLPWKQMPETLNLTHPQDIQAIHQAYVDAGSNIILANTFGAHPLRTAAYGLSAEELIAAGIQNARQAADGKALVALDIGPCGQLLEPLGSLGFEEAIEGFAQMVKAGAEAGAELVFIETMSSLAEARAALLAARENCDLPVLVSLTFEENGRTFTGASVEGAIKSLEAAGADVIGFNCSLGPDQMAALVRRAAACTNLPILCKPNAGLPDPITQEYPLNPQDFATQMKEVVAQGATLIGGCCGTNPDFIAALKEECGALKVDHPVIPAIPWASSERKALPLDRIQVIGERINPTGKKRLQQALKDQDFDYIVALALQQEKEGADLLDVNAGYPGVDEEYMLAQMVARIQTVCDLPLQLDSTSPQALEAALRVYQGKAIVNSFNADPKTAAAILPIVKKYGACVIGLCLDEKGVPQSCAQRIQLASRCLELAREYGIPEEDVLIDPLTLTVSAQPEQALETLKACTILKEEMNRSVVLGVSNISYGLPDRPAITAAFLAQALYAGLRLPIINPGQKILMDTIDAARVLLLEDENCQSYITRHQNQKAAIPVSTELNLHQALLQGLAQEASVLAAQALESCSENELIQKELIPALDEAGKQYEKGTLYLPQLLSCAKAAQAVFEVIRKSILEQGQPMLKKEKILLATVEGDVHDIGKNIVKTILENYGYDIIDLGKDVPPARIVRTVQEEEIALVGLSALMTTTLPAMEKTIQALKALENPPQIMVGGAVVTPEFAKQAGADFWCHDANDNIAAARKVFGHE